MCQTFYLSRKITKEHGAAVNNLASLIFSLSKKGAEGVTATEHFLAYCSGLSDRNVSRIKKLLKELGYIEIVRKKDLCFKGLTIFATQRLLDAFSDVNDTAQFAQDNRTNDMQDRQNDVRIDCENNAPNTYTEIANFEKKIANNVSADRNVCGHNYNIINNYKELKKFKDIAREKNNDANHLDDDRNFEPSDEIGSSTSDGSQTRDQIERVPRNLLKRAHFAQEGSNSPLTSNYTQNTNIAPSKRSMNVLEGTGDISATPKSAQAEKTTKKRQKSEVIYPQSISEVLKLFQDWKDSHVQIEPRIQGVNLQLEAEAFFNYWSSQDWKRKGKPIKSIPGTVATWLMNSCTRVRGSYKAPANDVELAKEREMFERFSSQNFSFSPNQNHDPILADAEVINDDSKLLGGL